MKPLSGIIIFVFALYFMGCAPMKVNFDPQLNITELNLGAGKKISLQVYDARPETTFGRTAPARPPLNSDQNIAELFKDRISDGLRKKGFDVLQDAKLNQPDLTVEIRLLKLSSSGIGFFSKLTFKCICKNSSKPYENIFRKNAFRKSDLLQNISNLVTKKMASDVLNNVVSQGLERMLQDVELLKCLKTA